MLKLDMLPAALEPDLLESEPDSLEFEPDLLNWCGINVQPQRQSLQIQVWNQLKPDSLDAELDPQAAFGWFEIRLVTKCAQQT